MSLLNTHFGADRIETLLRDCGRLMFIGIGGVSMCALAEVAMTQGFAVCGSDRCNSARLERLSALGAEIFRGHDAAHTDGVDAAVYTVAIGEDNPEYLALRQAGKPLISRADFLGYVMSRYGTRIGVAGMNGKSTTTAMCGHIFRGWGDPTVLGGAEAEVLGGASCYIGKSREHLIFEACEYKDSFLSLFPSVAVILNVGMDHVDYFHSMEQIRASFRAYAELTGQDGVVIVNADDGDAMASVEGISQRVVTFGVNENADFRAEDITNEKGCRRFWFTHQGERLCRISLRQPGEFQVSNALAAATAAYACGVAPEIIARQIASFGGVHRRMEFKGRLNGADVYDDYAHHPSAIVSMLEGAREMGYERVLCAYQPHTYSRTAGLFDEFSRAFDLADKCYFADIYAAREQNVSGVTSSQLAEAVGERAVYCGDFHTLARRLTEDAREGDLLLIMGAGDIEQTFALLDLK